MRQGRSFKLGELAVALGATLEGDPARVVQGVAPLESAGPDQITFVIDTRHAKAAQTSRAGAFLAPFEVLELPGAVLRCPDARRALIDLLALVYPPSSPKPGVDPAATIAPGARVDPTAWIGAGAVVRAGAVVGAGAQIHPLAYVGAGAEVGEDCVLHPHVVLCDGVRLGRRVIIHPGAVIGADGFGYVFDGAGHRKIPQVGGVVIEDDVEIGANTTIDRSTLGDTIIGRGTKIDNLVQIGHNVEIGGHCIIAAQTGIAGSSRLGRGVVLGGQVGVNDHITIGDGVMAGAQSGIPADVPAGEKILGTPSRPIGQARRIMVVAGQLPELVRRVRALERKLDELQGGPGRTGGERKADDE